MPTAVASALADICAGFRMRRVWMALASEDIGDQHKRTALGPLWLLINYLAFAGTFIFIFERGAGIPNYQAYVATGLLVWFYIMETINQGVLLFSREEGFIKGTTLPLSVYVMRLVMQSVIRAGYAVVGCLAIVFISGIGPSAMWVWSLLGIAIILATAPAAIICFAFLGVYFPDGRYFVQNLMRIGMFLTPVFWAPEGRGGIRGAFYYYNPFTYFLEIVRMPIVSGEFPLGALALCAAISVALWCLALILLGTFKRKIVFLL